MTISEIDQLYNLARLGFSVVPVAVVHPDHGDCELVMDAQGMSLKALAGDFSRYCKWEDL